MATKNVYSFLSVACVISGPGGIVNLAQGSGSAEEGITIEADGDISTKQMGADGSGQHSLHADKSGRATVRLLKTSPVNALLMGMYNFQTATPAAHGQNTISLADTARGDSVTLRQSAFKKAPTLTYGKEAGLNEWEFEAIYVDRGLA